MSRTNRSGPTAPGDGSPAQKTLSTVVIAIGSNLGDRGWYLRRAIEELRRIIGVVRVSSVIETEPVDAPPPKFLNMVVAGYTRLSPEELLEALQAIETRLGRRRTQRNAPRVIDLDLILHSANVRRTPRLTLPHPRFRQRDFVMQPMRELGLPVIPSRADGEGSPWSQAKTKEIPRALRRSGLEATAFQTRRPAPHAGGHGR